MKTRPGANQQVDGVSTVDCAVPQPSVSEVTPPGTSTHDGHTRAAVIKLLLEEGPITAIKIGARLGLSPAGVRRHLDALIDSGEARSETSASWQQTGRGRRAKQFQLTAAGRSRLGHAYDELAKAALRELRELGGDSAIEAFAQRRITSLIADIAPVRNASAEEIESAAHQIAESLNSSGFAASTRRVGNGVQICQHHCPISHVAAEFPELCEAEQRAFAHVLGSHVQRLATIANGDCVCTTHVPLLPTSAISASSVV